MQDGWSKTIKRYAPAATLLALTAAVGAHFAPHSPFRLETTRPRPTTAPARPSESALRAPAESLENYLRRREDEAMLGRGLPEQKLFPEPDSALLAYAASVDGRRGEDLEAPPTLEVAQLLGEDAQPFAAALAAYRAGDFAQGDTLAADLKSPIARTAAEWTGLRLHPREAGFLRLTRFAAAHPGWPAQEWLRRRTEEALYGDPHSDARIKDFFAARPPATAAGKIALARVLAREGDFVASSALIEESWRNDDFNEQIESVIRKEFSEFLTPEDHKYRSDRLLYAERNGAGIRIAELLGKDVAYLARVRAAANDDAAGEKLFASVAPALQKDAGLLYARIHMLRKQDKIAEAAALIRKAPTAPGLIVDGDAWWTERRMLARKLLDMGDARGAYEICAAHAARTNSSQVEAEFHAGWIALRFLGDVDAAERHFDRLVQIAETPISKSRGAYWRGRAAEARRTPEADARANAFYREAAAHSTTFYGQLAIAKIGSDASPVRPAPVAAVGDARDESVRAVELLLAAGEREPATLLASEAAKNLTSDAQVAALAEAAQRPRDARFSLTLGKLASYRGIALDDAAFPAYGVPKFTFLPGSASRSIVYAIARQESAFDSHAVSSAGAMGLMQMIASTARHTASVARVGFDLRRMLTEPAFNAQLGAAHLGLLLGEHKGSYLLTFAAYNAGGKRVKEWIDAYGDPRRGDVDPIDWVERIPISETRNYVQRVMENFVVYRAKFGEQSVRAPQMDLARVQ
jgi:soluble lytic murein transglycosylase